MFGRVALCGIAAFLLVSPASSNGDTDGFADLPSAGLANAMDWSVIAETNAPDSPAVVLTNAAHQIAVQAMDQIQVRAADDTQAQIEMAALDPIEPTQPSIALPAPAAPSIASPALAEPFGLNAVPISSGGLLAKWTGVEADIRAENAILARCRDDARSCPQAAQNFLAIIAQGRAQTGRARIGIINRAINLAIRPMSDLAQWGVIDKWSAPLESLTTGLGDCEDYAIAKYVALREAGVAAEDVKLVIVHNTAAAEDHAVTAVRLDGDWIVLDNRWLTLVADNEMQAAIPLFVLDQNGVKQFMPAIVPNVRRAAAPRDGIASVPGSL